MLASVMSYDPRCLRAGVLPTALQPRSKPIEQIFARLNHRMRDAAERTVEHIWRRVGAILQTFAPDECANYLENSGYAAV
jgi:hypothetical protein